MAKTYLPAKWCSINNVVGRGKKSGYKNKRRIIYVIAGLWARVFISCSKHKGKHIGTLHQTLGPDNRAPRGRSICLSLAERSPYTPYFRVLQRCRAQQCARGRYKKSAARSAHERKFTVRRDRRWPVRRARSGALDKDIERALWAARRIALLHRCAAWPLD